MIWAIAVIRRKTLIPSNGTETSQELCIIKDLLSRKTLIPSNGTETYQHPQQQRLDRRRKTLIPSNGTETRVWLVSLQPLDLRLVAKP